MLFPTNQDDDDYDVDDWPQETSLGKMMSEFEETIMCSICREHFNNPQMLKCGHSYCSICIQKHFDKTLNRNPATSEACPSCKAHAELFDIKPNRVLGAAVSKFVLLRKELLALMMKSERSDDGGPVRSVAAPINKNSTGSSSGSGEFKIIKRMPHYNLFGVPKDKVKKILEEITKPSRVKIRLDGDKEVLERRMRELIHSVNAQVDAPNALSLDGVIREINEREKCKDAEAKKSLRTLNSLENVKNGKVVKSFDHQFTQLAKKAMALKKAKMQQQQQQQQQEEESGNNDDGIDDKQQEEEEEERQHVNNASAAKRNATATQQSSTTYTKTTTDSSSRSSKSKPPSLGDYDWGPWRVVMSTKLGRPFFYNKETKIGQFQTPEELTVVPLNAIYDLDSVNVVVDDVAYEAVAGVASAAGRNDGGDEEREDEDDANAAGAGTAHDSSIHATTPKSRSSRATRSKSNTTSSAGAAGTSSGSSTASSRSSTRNSTGIKRQYTEKEDEEDEDENVDEASPLLDSSVVVEKKDIVEVDLLDDDDEDDDGDDDDEGEEEGETLNSDEPVHSKALKASAVLLESSSSSASLSHPTPTNTTGKRKAAAAAAAEGKDSSVAPTDVGTSRVGITTTARTSTSEDDNDNDTSKSNTSSSKDGAIWACSACTFHNPANTAACSICGTANPEYRSVATRRSLGGGGGGTAPSPAAPTITRVPFSDNSNSTINDAKKRRNK